jgi:hypothetical protein
VSLLERKHFPSHPTSKVVLAGAVVVLAVAPAWTQGGGSPGHSYSPAVGRVGTRMSSAGRATTLASPSARTAIGSPSLRMPVTTAPGATALTVPTAATFPAAGTTPVSGAAFITTSPSMMLPGGFVAGLGSTAPNLSQANPGAQDLGTPADPN